MVTSQQHILGLNIPVNELLFMSVLQGLSDLFDIGDNRWYRHRRTCGMQLAQRSVRGIIHDQERGALFNAEFKYANDVRMYQATEITRLVEEILHNRAGHLGEEDLDGSHRQDIDGIAQKP